MFLTGAMLCLAALTYRLLIKNNPPFQVHFPDAVLRPDYSYSFYLAIATGVLTILGSGVILFMSVVWPRKIATFFHHAIIEDDTMFEVRP